MKSLHEIPFQGPWILLYYSRSLIVSSVVFITCQSYTLSSCKQLEFMRLFTIFITCLVNAIPTVLRHNIINIFMGKQ